jgi:hypothetical protein
MMGALDWFVLGMLLGVGVATLIFIYRTSR